MANGEEGRDYGSGGGGGSASGGGWNFDLPGRDDATRAALAFYDELLKQRPGSQVVAPNLILLPNGRIVPIITDADGTPKLGEQWTEADSNAWLNANASGAGGGGAGSGGSRLASDDPRYWANLDRQYELDLMRLQQDYMNMGLDAESARRQALASLIANRNNTAVDVANTSASVAKTIADYAANPRDAVAELIYRNQVGGVAPFRDTANTAFGGYGKALAEKGASIFQPVGADLAQARTYRDSIPPVDFFGAETRSQLGLQPTPAQQLTGEGAVSGLASAPTPTNNNELAGALQFLQAMQDPAKADAFRKWTTASAAGGGTFNFDSMFESRAKPGYSPSSSEGGTNMDIHERAVIVGESGHIYATLGEKRPDGSIRAEQLQVKPLKSEVEKDKKLAEAGKAVVESQKQTLGAFAQGGTLNATPEDFMDQLSQLLSRFGGQGGGTATPLGGARHLVGAPANEILADPVLKDYVDAGYSAQGVDPRSLWAEINRFTPKDAQLVGQTRPRVSFI